MPTTSRHKSSAEPVIFDLAQEVMVHCEALALHTEHSGVVSRTFLSPPMHETHRDVQAWMADAGMTSRVDAMGNVIGRRDGRDPRTILIGSHLDTVHNAGKYDGILGVMVGIAAVKSLADEGLSFSVEVIGFSEEEGVRFSAPFLGSMALCGAFDDELLSRTDLAGVSLAESVKNFGLEIGELKSSAFAKENVIAYIEPHIEQGPVLELGSRSLGVVNAIAGQTRIVLSFAGEAGHAGTVPMRKRLDALPAASELALYVERYGRCAHELFATVGQFTVEPNISNVIPSRVRISMDIRHGIDETREAAVSAILAHAAAIATRRNLELVIESRTDRRAAPLDRSLMECMSAAIRAEAMEPVELVSGAGHDAMVLAAHVPSAMLFIRCKGGISHHPDESVTVEDVADAIRVLRRMISELKPIEKEKD